MTKEKVKIRINVKHRKIVNLIVKMTIMDKLKVVKLNRNKNLKSCKF